MVENKLTVDVYTQEGAKAGSLSLNPEIFAAPINKRLLNLALTGYAANQREGNASTKTRKEVRGGGKKPWRQKGTGRARVGSNRSPIWRGGGTVFGPHTRDYRVFLPKTMRLAALRTALSLRCKENEIMVLENLALTQPKTKEFVKILKALKVDAGKILFVVDAYSENLKRASRNLQTVTVSESREVTAYDVLRKKRILILKTALPIIEKRFAKPSKLEPAGVK